MKSEKSKDKLALKGFLIVGFLLFMAIAFVISNKLVVDGNIQVSNLVMTLIFVGFALFSLFPFLNFDKYYDQYKNSKNKPEKEINTPKWLKVLGLLFFGFFLVFINYSGINGYLSNESLNPSEMVSITGVLANDVEYISPAKGSHSLRFTTTEFPGLIFNIGFASDLSFITNYLSKGSKVEILIPKHKYQVWIEESEQKSFLDEHEAYGYISVFGLKDSEYIYFDFNKYNELIKEDNLIGLYIAIVLDLIALISVFLFLYYQKTNAINN